MGFKFWYSGRIQVQICQVSVFIDWFVFFFECFFSKWYIMFCSFDGVEFFCLVLVSENYDVGFDGDKWDEDGEFGG